MGTKLLSRMMTMHILFFRAGSLCRVLHLKQQILKIFQTFINPGYIWSTYHMPELWGFDPDADLTDPASYPASFTNALKAVKKHAGDISIHAEVFSPFTHLLELFGYQEALMGMMIYPDICKKLLEYFTKITLAEVNVYAAEGGIDAILVSSAFAGAGFISRDDYRQFVMPYEDVVFKEIKAHNLFSYVHTCGAIGDRLDLMAQTSVDGIDTLDPPPLRYSAPRMKPKQNSVTDSS